MLRRELGMRGVAQAVAAAMGGVSEINATLAAGDITPTGVELHTNNDFSTWTADNPDGWTVGGESGSDPMVTETVDGARMYTSGGWVYLKQVDAELGAWYRSVVTCAAYAAGSFRNEYQGQGNIEVFPARTGTFTVCFESAKSNVGLCLSRALSAGENDYTFSKWSLLKLTLSSMTIGLGDIKRSTGTWTCTPTVADDTQAGIALNYADADNCVIAYVDRRQAVARLVKRIGGVRTEVVSGSIVYSAGAELRVVVSGTDYALYYNEAQVGATTAINDAGLGTEVKGFSSHASSTPGVVQTNPT